MPVLEIRHVRGRGAGGQRDFPPLRGSRLRTSEGSKKCCQHHILKLESSFSY